MLNQLQLVHVYTDSYSEPYTKNHDFTINV